MTPETLIQIQNIIEKFGFPVFVALCGLLLFAAVLGRGNSRRMPTEYL